MRSLQVTLASAAALLLATSAAAQTGGTVEFGTYGRYTEFGDVLTLDSRMGAGGRLGYFFLSRFGLETSASFTPTQDAGGIIDDVTYVPISARLVYSQPISGGFNVLLGFGYVRNQFRVGGLWGGDNGFGGLLGMRLRMGNTFALRVDASADHMPELSDLSSSVRDNTNLGLEAGLSIMFGGGSKGRDWEPYSADEYRPVGPVVVAVDSDGDGIMDDSDRCPGTDAGVAVDDGGCALPVPTNGDPATNGDELIAEPEVVDSDGDGVLDDLDACANTAPDTDVDDAGCPILFEAEEVEIVLDGVTFLPNKWELTLNARAILDGVAVSLLANPSIRVEIAGYTDSTGTQRRNLWLSQTRADAVKLYLYERGVPRDRMTTRGYGPADPVASNATRAGRAQNRRVELHRLN